MIYNGILKYQNDNSYGIFDNRKGEYINLSHEIDRLRNSKVHIHIKDKNGKTLYSQKGVVSSRRVFDKVFDIYIGENINSLKSENNNDLSIGSNLTQVLFENCEERVSISIKELSRDNTGDEVIK